MGGSTGALFGSYDGLTLDRYFQSAILKYFWTPRLTLFVEYFAPFEGHYHDGSTGDVLDTGVKWCFFNNVQLDWIIAYPGVKNGSGYFTGAGLSFRY